MSPPLNLTSPITRNTKLNPNRKTEARPAEVEIAIFDNLPISCLHTFHCHISWYCYVLFRMVSNSQGSFYHYFSCWVWEPKHNENINTFDVLHVDREGCKLINYNVSFGHMIGSQQNSNMMLLISLVMISKLVWLPIGFTCQKKEIY